MPSLPNLSPPGNRKYRWYGLIKEGQEDFSGGAFFGQERVPPNGCEDIINGYVDQDGGIARRGGSTLRGPTIGSTPALTAPAFLWDGYLAAGRRTVQSRDSLYVMDTSEASWVGKGTAGNASRPIALAGLLWYVSGTSINAIGSNMTIPGGSATGTITITKGSTKVTGSGTNFLSIAVPGMLLFLPKTVSGDADTTRVLAIQTVTNDTTMTLATPWGNDTQTGLAVTTQWNIFDSRGRSLADPSYPNSSPFLGTTGPKEVLATAADRLIVGYGTRVAFSNAGDASIFTSTDYHELPAGALVTGLEGIRDSCLVFTTRGVWAIRNLAYDLTDAQGNVQQQLQPIYPDLGLWDEIGIANYLGSAVVPAIDGVYLLDGANAPVGLTNEAILPLYRGYVAAGYAPGQATIFQSKYILPILNGSTWVDTLVCDLRSRSWTRWDGYGGSINRFATRIGDTARQPVLLGAKPGNTSLVDLSQVFSSSSSVKNDADGSTHQLKVTFRTLTAGTIPVQWRKFRVRFEADDTVLFSTHFSQGLVTGTPITSLPIVAALTAVPAGSTLVAQSSDGLHTQTWVTTAPVNIGDVSIAVASQAPNFAYGTLSTLTTQGTTDDPQLQAEFATGRPGNAFTTLSGSGPEGETTFNWQTSKKARAIRYRVTSLHAASRFVIRSFESFYRYTGRT